MTIAICDDCSEIVKEIEAHIRKSGLVANIRTFSSGEELLAADFRPDIIFLDIELGGKNGIDVAKELRARYLDVIIIFVSSHREYVFDAFRCEALHFILKPISASEFDEIFSRAVHKYQLLNSFFTVRYKQEISKVRIDDILFVEVSHRRLVIHTANSKFEHSDKLYKVYEELEPYGYVYIHQGCIVNMRHIESVEADSITVGGQRLAMSVRRRPEVLRDFNRYIAKSKW